MKKALIFIPILLVILAGGIAGYSYYKSSHADFPGTKAKHLDFVPYTSDTPWKLSSSSYESDSGVFSTTHYMGDKTIALKQQSTPSDFAASADYYEKLLEKLHQYQELKIGSETITLTRPSELDGSQTAVRNSHGVLLFASPNKQLSDDEWRSFFGSLRPGSL
jgi:hypothetical protein